ncbi:MAG: lipase, partial [Kiritimatiellae bacterium]|jgi:acetyl esterase/lipase|nr:lipase [Kiritimatiellia bacterium]
MAPLYHVRADAPPTLLITGDREKEILGRYEENAYFWRMMRVAGHPNIELIEIPGTDHGGMVAPAFSYFMPFIRRV